MAEENVPRLQTPNYTVVGREEVGTEVTTYVVMNGELMTFVATREDIMIGRNIGTTALNEVETGEQPNE